MRLPVFTAEPTGTPVGHLDTERKLLGFTERKRYLIEAPDNNATLYADDAPLEMDDSEEYWLWEPGFFAGELALELELPGNAAPLSFIVDVGPSEHKTGRAQFAQYIEQIVDYAPQLVAGNEPATEGLGGRSDTLSLWQRYARLRQFIDRYLSGLQAIRERPIIRLTSHREQLPLHMAKRVDGITLQRLVSNPGLLSVLAGKSDPEHVLTGSEYNLDAPVHEPTLDNPANRLVARQLSEVRRLTRFLRDEIKSLKVSASETETDLMARLPRRIGWLERVDKQLCRLSKSTPFVNTNIQKRGSAEFNAVSGNPHYNMTHQMGVRLLRQGLSELVDDERHYLSPTWGIYEAWCFVAIAEQLEARFPEFSWQFQTNAPSADLLLVGHSGGKRISLFYQMTCRSLEKANHYGYYSISRERRPDLILEVLEGDQKQFVCMDSKYTASHGGILDAMSSAHIYRDSLRCDSLHCSLSILLVPANTTLPMLTTEDYWREHKVGCATLGDNEDASAVIDRVLGLLDPSAKHSA